MNILNLFTNKISALPFCVKYLLYTKLCKDFQGQYDAKALENNKSFLTYNPILTFRGETELRRKECKFDNNIYNFLQYCADGKNLYEISVNTYLSLEETAKYCEFCIEQNYLTKPDSLKILSLIGFISGKFRIGEYLEAVGIINNNQLQNAINIQEKNSDKALGEILVELDCIKKDELKTLLALKEDANKRFILNHDDIPKAEMIYSDGNDKYKQEIKKLKEENSNLKIRMNQILKLVRENAK